MDETESSVKTQSQQNHSELVSQVEPSFVALNLEEVTISDKSLPKTSPDGEPIKRESLKGGQIKVRVKTLEEEEGEHEADQETHGKSNSSLPPLSPPLVGGTEEHSFAETSPTTPPSTPRTFEDDDALFKFLNGSEFHEPENENEVEDIQSSSEVREDDEESLKKENVHSTLIEKECVVPEVLIVWEYVSKFIIQKALEGFAVRIPGVGTFTYSILPNDIIKVPVEAGKIALRKSRKFPVFKICPHVKEMYKLVEENYLYQCNVPTVPLNVNVVASDSKLSPGIVDGIMVETLQSFITGVITNKNMEFPFPFIGKLFVKQRKVFMMFYQQFCEGLSFDFNYAPSYISSVFPGNMTPLAYHRPANQFHSVFHFSEVRSVENKIIATPRPYAKGKLILGSTGSGDPCELTKNLFNHSNLLYDCTCCKAKSNSDHNEVNETPDGFSNPPCGYSKNYDRIRKACCMQYGNFVFQKPDGSTFSPEPLFKSAKTGNPILDRLADDRCLLQQAIGCWMKRKVVQTLGTESIAKHHDREYLRRLYQKEKETSVGGYLRKSYLVPDTEKLSITPTTLSPSPSSAHVRKSFRSDSSRKSHSLSLEEDAEAFEREDVEDSEEDDLNTHIRGSSDVKAIQSIRKSAEVAVDLVENLGEAEQIERRNSRSSEMQEIFQSSEVSLETQDHVEVEDLGHNE